MLSFSKARESVAVGTDVIVVVLMESTVLENVLEPVCPSIKGLVPAVSTGPCVLLGCSPPAANR